jgi:hypothetical protein
MQPNRAASIQVLAASLATTPLQSAVSYVSHSQTTNTPPDGLSWATAFSSIQPAIDAAGEGGDVWVSEGTYFESLLLRCGVRLYGGFRGGEEGLGERDWMGRKSILDGRHEATVIVIQEGATGSTRVDGFTIQNGVAFEGGGIYCSNASPWIANNVITSNRATAYSADTGGGGLVLRSGAPVITNNVIAGNHSRRLAGAIESAEASPLIVNNVFENNTAEDVVGGLRVNGGKPVITGNLFLRNSAFTVGALELFSVADEVLVDGNVFEGNAGSYGSAIRDFGFRSHLIINNLFVANTNLQGLGGVLTCVSRSKARVVNNTLLSSRSSYPPRPGIAVSAGGADLLLANNLIAANGVGLAYSGGSITISHNCIHGNAGSDYQGITDPTGTDGNISVDPMLVEGDWHLGEGSPCIDAGRSSVVDPRWLDLDGEGRVAGLSVDMGADEAGSFIPLTIVQTSLPPGIAGRAYSVRLEVVAGASPLTWSLAGGSQAPPAGISLSADGLLAGVPSGTGEFVLAILVVDATGAMGWRTLELSIIAPVLTLRIPQQNAAEITADGCRLTFSADTPGDYVIERSLNLSEWDQVMSLTYVAGEEDLVDTGVRGATVLFYRASQQSGGRDAP